MTDLLKTKRDQDGAEFYFEFSDQRNRFVVITKQRYDELSNNAKRTFNVWNKSEKGYTRFYKSISIGDNDV